MKRLVKNLEKLREENEVVILYNEKGVPQKTESLEIIKELTNYMEKHKDILALSAPQIGIKKRIFCIRFDDTIKAFINPIITKKKGQKILLETCASMPNNEIVIGRPEEVTVVYYNNNVEYEDNKILGIAAGLFDQQCQLLDGILPCDLGMVSDIEKDGKVEEDDFEEIVKFYAETFLPTRLEQLNKSFENDEELMKAYKKLKFEEAVINDRIQLVDPSELIDTDKEAKKLAKKSIAEIAKNEDAAKKAGFKVYANKMLKNKKHFS